MAAAAPPQGPVKAPPQATPMGGLPGASGSAGAAASSASPAAGRTAVHGAKIFSRVRDQGELAVLELLSAGLLDSGARAPPHQQNLMFFAAARVQGRGGSEAVARRLAALGVPGNALDRMCQTPLFYAAREGNVGCAAFLVEQRCDVNQRDINGQSPLFYAVREGRDAMTRELVRLGASEDIRDNQDRTARSYARAEWQAASGSDLGHPDPGGRKQPLKGRKTQLALPHAAGQPPPKRAKAEGKPTARQQPQRGRLRALGGALCRGQARQQSLERWAQGPAGRLGPVASRPCVAGEALALAGEYSVRVPLACDVPRLRELEREFVLDHGQLFEGEAWHPELSPSDWCSLVNVVAEEDHAQQAIVSIIAGRTRGHATLHCVHRPPSQPSGAGAGRAPQARIVGYVHAVFARVGDGEPDEDGEEQSRSLDISHLKVDKEYQRRGLGSLLIAGLARHAQRLGWDVRSLRLVVVGPNVAARRLYSALRFEEKGVNERAVCVGTGTAMVRWHRMQRSLRGSSLGAFSKQCEALARRHTEANPAV